MPEKCIIPEDWKEYFDDISKKMKNMEEKVEIEIVAPAVLKAEEGKGLTVLGISYDPKDKILCILSEGLEHHIKNPQEICIEEEDGGLKVIRAVDNSGAEHFIKFAIPIK